MAKIIAAYARSKNEIVMGCASTALAASIYKDNFYTAHALFKIPVVEDEEEDLNQEGDLECLLSKNLNRYNLLKETRVFIWDEISSQHVRDFSAAYRAMNGFDNKIIILMGDKMQIAPVVKYGSKIQILNASIYNSDFMNYFTLYSFTQNLRLIASNDPNQDNYAKTLLEIGKGIIFLFVNIFNIIIFHMIIKFLYYINKKYYFMIGTYFKDQINNQNSIKIIPQNELPIDESKPNKEIGTTTIAFNNIGYETNVTNMISFLHPNDFNIETISTNCMLAVTNEQVDVWNNEIQKLNTQEIKCLLSNDSFNEIDDPNNFFKNMITDEVMNKFNENGKPPHILNLKIGDICILLRHVDNEKGLTSNTRVRIVNINPHRIIIQSLESENPVTASLCRFIFYLQLPFKKSLKMERKQFPLRLAYSISINKSQGQEFQKVGLDITVPSFAHGHLYVSLSRIRNYNNIKFFVNDTNLIDNIPVTDNVVYEEIVNCFDNII